MITLIPALLSSQVVVGGDIPDPSAALDIRSTEKGVLLPRLTTAERDAVSSPATGLTIFNTSSNCLEANLGTPAVPDWVGIKCRTGVISALDCSNAVPTGALTPGQAASGVSVSVSYTGGNGGVHDGQTVASTGVTGLTATLSAGSFESGSGNLSYSITGTPAGIGNASFALNIGGQTCTLNIKYWQWGISEQAVAGPTGPGAGDANDGAVSGWYTTGAPDGSWTDGSKTPNDPCPMGYRIPTKAQWDGVVANNTITNTGSFGNSATNYGAGIKFGDQLMLPAAGYRDFVNGALYYRGNYGYYWSSTEFDNFNAWYLFFYSSGTITYYFYSRTYGLSVRCISE